MPSSSDLIHGVKLPHLVRSSLVTFIFLCALAAAICMLALGLFFQIGAQFSPWLLANGWALLKFTFVLLVCFRVGILLCRLLRRVHRHLKKRADYRALLVLARGTLLYLLEKIIWALLQ